MCIENKAFSWRGDGNRYMFSLNNGGYELLTEVVVLVAGSPFMVLYCVNLRHDKRRCPADPAFVWR